MADQVQAEGPIEQSELLDPVETRDLLERMAQLLHGLQERLPEGRVRRTLRSCATQVSWASERLPVKDAAPLARMEPVPAKARAAAQALPGLHGTSLVLLALLMAQPGRVRSCHRLGADLGVAQKSVRVFAFYLRRWLQEAGLGDALVTHTGIGYSVSAAVAEQLRGCHPALAALTDAVASRMQGWLPSDSGGLAPAYGDGPCAEQADVEIAGGR